MQSKEVEKMYTGSEIYLQIDYKKELHKYAGDIAQTKIKILLLLIFQFFDSIYPLIKHFNSII